MSHDSSPELQARLELAIDVARAAGEIAVSYFRNRDLRVDKKSDHSPVTDADREAETYLREQILASFPNDSILGEEFGETVGTNAYRWTLDPIDGTKSFVAGVPLYAMAIGILENGAGRAGLIYAPSTGEMVYAAAGDGAWYREGNGPPTAAKVSETKNLEDALFLTTEVKSFTRYRKEDAVDVFVELQRKTRLTRTWGDDYGYLLVATGRADVMIDPALNFWDAAPLLTIITEAGGIFTDWTGESTIHSGEGIATNGVLHHAVLAAVEGR